MDRVPPRPPPPPAKGGAKFLPVFASLSVAFLVYLQFAPGVLDEYLPTMDAVQESEEQEEE